LNNTIATAIIATTINTKEILLQQGVQEKKIFLVHYGFDIKRMMEPSKEEVARIKYLYNGRDQHPVIGIVARWVDWKGIQYSIAAFKKLLQQYPTAKLCLFNASETAPYAKQIDQLLHQLPAENYITVPFEYNVYDMYQLFDIYVHTPVNSTCEAFGQTYVEALAAGIPGIFTLSGVAKEFIKNEENALTVNFENSEEIYQAIIRLLENVDLANKLTTNGKKDVLQLFTMNIYIDKLLALYK
jgi:glycosyltransferase involved in cell wall biosynthesis